MKDRQWCFWLFGWGWKRGEILVGFTSFLFFFFLLNYVKVIVSHHLADILILNIKKKKADILMKIIYHIWLGQRVSVVWFSDLKFSKKKQKKKKPSMLSLPSHLKFEKPITSLFYLKKSNWKRRKWGKATKPRIYTKELSVVLIWQENESQLN